jgi:hypothetical protein
VQEAEGQCYKVVKEGDQTIEGLKDYEISYKIIKEQEIKQ